MQLKKLVASATLIAGLGGVGAMTLVPAVVAGSTSTAGLPGGTPVPIENPLPDPGPFGPGFPGWPVTSTSTP